MSKEQPLEKRRLGYEDDADHEQGDDKDAEEATVFPEDDVRKDHDEDGRAEDDGGRVADWQPGKPDEDAGDRQASDDALQVDQEPRALGSQRVGPHAGHDGDGQRQLDDGPEQQDLGGIDALQHLDHHRAQGEKESGNGRQKDAHELVSRPWRILFLQGVVFRRRRRQR